jgi:hypothetical protein
MPNKDRPQSTSDARESRNRSGKMQGEGDYESARRFNDDEQRFVGEKGVTRLPPLSSDEEKKFSEAEEKGKSRGKEREHDAVDEALLREEISERRGNTEKH